ncbi:MAG: hypothetical protein FWK01_25485 [Pantanalinema sp. GBBB05]|nr:hypothetical protein [Pantanalinema sp. GBBB05]
MLYPVLNETDVCLFNFYLNGAMRQGMRLKLALYEETHLFSVNDRLKAYNFAAQLADIGCLPIVTVSTMGYRVWVNLKSDGYQYWRDVNQENYPMAAA